MCNLPLRVAHCIVQLAHMLKVYLEQLQFAWSVSSLFLIDIDEI